MESMLEKSMAEYYGAELPEKIHRGQKNAQKGCSNGGRVPFGYRLTERGWRLTRLPLLLQKKYSNDVKTAKPFVLSRTIKTARNQNSYGIGFHLFQLWNTAKKQDRNDHPRRHSGDCHPCYI